MRFIGLMLGLASLVMCGGCEGMQKFDASVRMDSSLADASGTFPPVRVHLIGVQDGDELEKYRQYSVDQWFAPDNDLRRGAVTQGMVRELNFGPGQQSTQTLSKKDPIWKTWQGRSAAYLVVVANLPAPANSAAGAEPRKLVLPLSSKRWDDPDVVTVDVRQSTMTATPGPKPAK